MEKKIAQSENDCWFCKEMRVRLFDIESRAFISIMHEADARELGVSPTERVALRLNRNNKEIVTVVDTTTTMVKPGEIGLFRDVSHRLGAVSTETILVTPSPQPESVGFIKKKIRGLELSESEIKAIISDIANNRLSEIESSAFMTAVYIHGNTLPEIVAMTKALSAGGETIVLAKKPVVDKHSIGGINGRVSMVLVPIVAAAGLFIPKTASRSITSACGTADAMEVLCDVELTVAKIKSITEEIGGVIAWGGAVDLAPGDDKIIKIEHPLSLDPEGQVIASVMAKKFSVGARFLVIDIPVGPHMKVTSREKAEEMARRFIEVGKKLGMHVEVALTDGTEPCGRAFGAALEAKEALETLEGKRFDNLGEKACELAGILLEMAGAAKKKQGLIIARNLLQSGKALQKMKEIIRAQNGKIFSSGEIRLAKFKFTIVSDADGEISVMNLGRLIGTARRAGAPADPFAGIVMLVQKGNTVTKGQPLFEIYSDNAQKLEFAKRFATESNGIELQHIVLKQIE